MSISFWILIIGLILILLIDPLTMLLYDISSPPSEDVWASKGRLIDLANRGDAGKTRDFLRKNPARYYLDARDSAGMTALMHAAKRGHNEIVRILLDEGADATLLDHQHSTALSMAEEEGHVEVAQMIRKAIARAR